MCLIYIQGSLASNMKPLFVFINIIASLNILQIPGELDRLSGTARIQGHILSTKSWIAQKCKYNAVSSCSVVKSRQVEFRNSEICIAFALLDWKTMDILIFWAHLSSPAISRTGMYMFSS